MGAVIFILLPDFFWLSASAFIALDIHQHEASENSIPFKPLCLRRTREFLIHGKAMKGVDNCLSEAERIPMDPVNPGRPHVWLIVPLHSSCE